MRRGLLPVVGSRVVAAERPPCLRRPIRFTPRIDAFRRRVVGRRIDSVGRRGKRVMLGLEDDQWVVIEPRMSGLVLLTDPPTREHLRLRLTLEGNGPHELLFWDRRGLGTVRLFRSEELAREVDARLGVDALEVDAVGLRDRLRASRRAIKVALLDQTRVAGIGNLYAAEILFLAGIDPRTRCDRMTRPQWQRVAAAIPTVLQEAIRREGSTLRDGTYRNALNDPGSYQNRHRVYDRAGIVCTRCLEGTIRRIVQAQRSTFFCPACQLRWGQHRSVAIDVRCDSPAP